MPVSPHGNSDLQQPVDTAAAAGAGKNHSLRREEYHGLRLLISDARVVLLLMDDVNYRVIARLFGVPKDQAWLVTPIALGLLARAAHSKFESAMSGPGGPTRADPVLAAAMLRETAHRVAGPSSREVRFFAALLALGVSGHMARPALAGSARGIRGVARQAAAAHRRFGHLARQPTRP